MRLIMFGNTPFDLRTMTEALRLSSDVKEISWQSGSLRILSRNVLAFALFRFVEMCYRCLSLFREIHVFQADLVIAQYAYYYGLIGAIAAKIARKPCIIHAIGSDLKIEPINRNHRVVVAAALQLAAGTICVSKDMENIAKTLGSRNTTVVPFPLDTTGFPAEEPSKNKNQVISVMRLIPIKGIPYLIKAMALNKKGKLLVIGDGPERAKSELLLRKLGLQDRVSFLGWVDRKDIWNYLKQSFVFALPSLSEGTPRVILEAMMCGLPVVATNVGGIPDLVEDGVNGILVPPRDEKALAEAMNRVLNDPDFQKTVAIRNKMAAGKFKIDIVGPKIDNYLRTFLNR